MLYPEKFETRELQICLASSTFPLQAPMPAGKSELKNIKILKQQLIRMLGLIMTFSELGINVKIAFCIKRLIIALVLWTFRFAKISWLSHILYSARFNSHTLICVCLVLERPSHGRGEMPSLQATMSLDIPVGK